MQETNFYEEHPQKEGWWLNELDTLGIDTENNNNELSDKQENSNLVETVKQSLLEDYKQTSSTNYQRQLKPSFHQDYFSNHIKNQNNNLGKYKTNIYHLQCT